MNNNLNSAIEKQSYKQLKNEHIEFQNFSEDQNQNPEQIRDSEYQSPKIIQQNDDDYEQQQNFGKNCVFKLNPLTGQPNYTLGPHWPLFIYAWGCFFAFDIFLIKMTWSNAENIFWFFFTVFACISHLTSYLATSMLNPGIAHKNDEVNRNLKKQQNLTSEQLKKIQCQKCHVLQDKQTEHCDDCNVCVRGYDHHCPWSSKCIAKGNLLAFKVFIGMTFIFMVYAILITVFIFLPSFGRSFRKSFDKNSDHNTDTKNFQ